MRRLGAIGIFFGAAILVATSAHAQYNGSHTPGDFGVLSGTQPAPGFYGAAFYYHYSTDSIGTETAIGSLCRRTSPPSTPSTRYSPQGPT